MARIYKRLGSWVLPRELEVIGLVSTPQYDPYVDETQNEQTFPQLAEELEPMPEVGDHYIGAKILLPRGDKLARGHVVVQSHDASGNIMGRAHTNPILDTGMYQVSLLEASLQNSAPTSLHSQCMPNAMQMGMSIYS